MQEIICPHCKKAFKVDEAGYADLLKQVRDHEFEQQLNERLELAEKDKQNAVELAKSQVSSEMQKTVLDKDAEIKELKAKLEAGDVQQRLAVSEALRDVEKERDALANELEKEKRASETTIRLTEAKLAQKLQETTAAKDAQIQDLEATINANSVAQKLAVNEAVNVVAKERDDFKNKLDQAMLEKELGEKLLKEQYETQLKDRD